MPLSVSYSKSGSGLSYLFKQARPVKSADDTSSAPSGDQPTVVQSRPMGRSVIDSTGSGAAQVAAALTIYMSNLGSIDVEATDGPKPAAAATRSRVSPAGAVSGQDASGEASAAGLLRALDAYAAFGSTPKRMTA